jgi:hypothetical protein
MGRNAGLALPGLTFAGPPESPYDTVVITRQYDGISNWPAHQLNVVADANAVLGALYLHNQSNYEVDLASLPAEDVTTTKNSLGATTTTYHLIPNTGLLPLLRPLHDVGVATALLEAIQLTLQPIVDSAYATPHTATGQPPRGVSHAALAAAMSPHRGTAGSDADVGGRAESRSRTAAGPSRWRSGRACVSGINGRTVLRCGPDRRKPTSTDRGPTGSSASRPTRTG